MFNKFAATLARRLSVEDRREARDIAVIAWHGSGFDALVAREIAVRRVKDWKKAKLASSGVGSIILIVTVAALMLQAIYYAIRIWNELNQTTVSGRSADEMFGL